MDIAPPGRLSGTIQTARISAVRGTTAWVVITFFRGAQRAGI